MPFNFTRSWNFDYTRAMDTGDLSDPTNPDTEFGKALAEFMEGLSVAGSLPPGGSLGMVLTKMSSTDGDAQWQAVLFPIGVPTGGATGQVMVKTGNGDTELGWTNLPAPANAAVAVSYAGSTNLAAANVEAALDELDAEKSPLVHTHAQADVTGLVTALANKVATTTAGIKLDSGTVLPAAGQAGRLFVLHA